MQSQSHIRNGIKSNVIFIRLAHKMLEIRLGLGILVPQDEIGTLSTAVYRFNFEIGLKNLEWATFQTLCGSKLN